MSTNTIRLHRVEHDVLDGGVARGQGRGAEDGFQAVGFGELADGRAVGGDDSAVQEARGARVLEGV